MDRSSDEKMKLTARATNLERAWRRKGNSGGCRTECGDRKRQENVEELAQNKAAMPVGLDRLLPAGEPVNCQVPAQLSQHFLNATARKVLARPETSKQKGRTASNRFGGRPQAKELGSQMKEMRSQLG